MDCACGSNWCNPPVDDHTSSGTAKSSNLGLPWRMRSYQMHEKHSCIGHACTSVSRPRTSHCLSWPQFAFLVSSRPMSWVMGRSAAKAGVRLSGTAQVGFLDIPGGAVELSRDLTPRLSTLSWANFLLFSDYPLFNPVLSSPARKLVLSYILMLRGKQFHGQPPAQGRDWTHLAATKEEKVLSDPSLTACHFRLPGLVSGAILSLRRDWSTPPSPGLSPPLGPPGSYCRVCLHGFLLTLLPADQVCAAIDGCTAHLSRTRTSRRNRGLRGTAARSCKTTLQRWGDLEMILSRSLVAPLPFFPRPSSAPSTTAWAQWLDASAALCIVSRQLFEWTGAYEGRDWTFA